MAVVQGEYDPKFQNVKDLLQQYVASGEELGASICINIDGKTVVDIWAGYSDVERKSPWEKDTLTAVWSTTKCITNLAALLLIDRGLLDPNERVAKYWPEFGENGKQDVLVRHVLSHTSGVPSWEQPITTQDIYDVPKAAERLAKQTPWWAPGTASGYHLISQGHLVGEIVHRVSGKPLREFVKTEIAEPLGADFSIGAEEKDWPRIAELVPPPTPVTPEDVDMSSVMMRAFAGSPMVGENAMTPEFRRAGLGGMGGFSNARAIVDILSAISLGGSTKGKRLLSEDTINLIFQEQATGPDLVIMAPLKFGIGYALATDAETSAWVPQGRKCWWTGWGGSVAIMDLENKVTIGYAMNKMGEGIVGSSRTEAYVKAIYAALSEA